MRNEEIPGAQEYADALCEALDAQGARVVKPPYRHDELFKEEVDDGRGSGSGDGTGAAAE